MARLKSGVPASPTPRDREQIIEDHLHAGLCVEAVRWEEGKLCVGRVVSEDTDFVVRSVGNGAT